MRYNAQVRCKGYETQSKTFYTYQEAADWVSDQERDIRDRAIDPRCIARRNNVAGMDKLACTEATKNRYLGAFSGCITQMSKQTLRSDPLFIGPNPCKLIQRGDDAKERQRIIKPCEWKLLMKHIDQAAEMTPAVRKPLKAHMKEFKKTGHSQVFRGRVSGKPADFDELIRTAIHEMIEPDFRGEMPVFHTVRHTAATEMGAAGATETEIMAVTGHKTSVTVQAPDDSDRT